MRDLNTYCKQNKIKIRNKDGLKQVSYSVRYNGTTHMNEFTLNLIKHLHRIIKITGWRYLPDNRSYNYNDWPVVKVRALFEEDNNVRI